MDKSKKYVSLQVTGNPDPNGGYRPIVLFNIVGEMIPVNENDYPGFSQNPFFFTFRIEDKRTLYTLVRNKVKSHGASRDGVSMKITISVPRGYRFESVAPYDVLVEMMDEFLQRAMTPIQGTGYYAYNSTRIEPTILDDIAKKYPLVASEDGPYRVMGNIGTAYMQLPDDKIRKLLCDVHYPEFQTYREIVVAEHVDATTYVKLPPLDIPRQPAYTIYVDGLPQQGTVKDKNQRMTYAGSKPAQCYDNSSVTFTIGELLAGKGDPCVTIDKANEEVRVDTSRLSKPKVTTWTLRFTPDTATQYFLRNSNVLVVYFDMGYGAPKPLPLDSKLSFTLRGEDLKLLDGHFKVSFNKKDEYEIKGVEEPNRNGGNVNVTVERITRRPVMPPTQFQSGTSSNAQMPVSQDCKLTITFAEGNPFGIGKDNRRKTFKLIMSDGSEYVTEVDFKQQLGAYKNSKAAGIPWIGEIPIPSSWIARVRYVRFDCGWCSYAESVWSNTTEVNGSAFNKKPVGLLNLKFGFWRLALMLLIALVVGFAGGYVTCGLTEWWPFGDEETEAKEEVKLEMVAVPSASMADKQLDEEKQAVDSVKCEKCDSMFADSMQLEEHNNIVHHLGGGNESSAGAHESETLADTNLKFKCERCQKLYNTNEELHNHWSSIYHLYFCDKCGQSTNFKTEKELAAHEKKTHKTCPYCEKVIVGDREYTKHMRNAHQDKL